MSGSFQAGTPRYRMISRLSRPRSMAISASLTRWKPPLGHPVQHSEKPPGAFGQGAVEVGDGELVGHRTTQAGPGFPTRVAGERTTRPALLAHEGEHPTSSISAERLTRPGLAMMPEATRASWFGHAAAFQPPRTSFGHATEPCAITPDPDNNLTSDPDKALSCTGPAPGSASTTQWPPSDGQARFSAWNERLSDAAGGAMRHACLRKRRDAARSSGMPPGRPARGGCPRPVLARFAIAVGLCLGWRPPVATATRKRPRRWRRRG